MNKNKHYLLFTIGPVKSFINESRKTQDLFAGSSLLSALSRKAIDAARHEFERNNFELITPQLADKVKAIPNRFLASFEMNDKDQIKSKVQEIEKAVRKMFRQFPCDFLKKLIKQKKKLPNGALEQLQDALEIHWIVMPASDDYQKDFIRINAELAAVKNRKRTQFKPETGRKCIVDGHRNVKFYRKNLNESLGINTNGYYYKLYQKPSDVLVVDYDDESILPIWQLQEGEGISAVTLRKRLYKNEPHAFPSTVAVALMHVFDYLENEIKDKDFIKFKNKVRGENKTKKYLTHSDDQLFYKENILDIFTKHGKNNEAAACIIDHEKWSKDLDIPLTKYYALIRFDGDTMGDWFSGKFFKNPDNLLDNQIKLSKSLGTFAQKITSKITAPLGKVIYAGGEDFMAFINIHSLTEAIKIIQKTFDAEVNQKIRGIARDNKQITLSMGIAIAHYKQPLSMVLQKAKDMESTAKNTAGRNAFALAVMKHSGSHIDCYYKWDKCTIDSILQIEGIIALLNAKTFSPAFLLNIYHSFEEYGFNMEDFLVETKIDLYVERAYTGTSKEKENKIKELTGYLKNLLTISDNNRIFGDTLLIIDFIYRKTY